MAVSIYIDMKETAVNESAKTSTVQCDVFAVSTGGSYNNLSPSGSVVFSGNASGTYSFKHNFSANTTTKIYTRTFTVTHSSDGTGSVTAKATFKTGVSSGTVTATKKITLTKISTASTFSVSGPMTFASNLAFTINRQNPSFTHLVQVSMGGSKVYEQGSVATTCTWSIPDNLSPSDSSSREATATVTTYNGGTIVGSTTQKFDIYVSDQNQPAINSVTIIDNMGYYDDYGVYLTNKSDFSVSINATAYSNATITKYWVRVGDGENTENHLNVVDIGSISLTGYITLTIGVEDSRGRTKTTMRNITLERPTAPRLTVYAFRTTSSSSNVENDEGNYIRIHVTGSTTRPGTKGTNNGTVVVKYKLQTSSSYTTLSSANRGSSWDFYTYFSGSASNVYDIQVTCTDQVGYSATQYYTIGTAEPMLDFKAGGEGLGIFSIADVDGIKMGKPIYLPQNSLDIYTWYNNAYQDLLNLSGGKATFNCGVFADSLGVDGNVQLNGSNSLVNWFYGSIVRLAFGLIDGDPALTWYGSAIGGDLNKVLVDNINWSSGTLSVPNQMKYNIFIIELGGHAAQVIAIRANLGSTGSYIVGIGGCASPSYAGNIFLQSVYFQSISTSVWRWNQVTSMNVRDSAYNNGLQHPAVTRIIGVI